MAKDVIHSDKKKSGPVRVRVRAQGRTLAIPALLPKPVGDLLFDPQNPRHPKSLEGVDEPALIDWMVENASIIELMNSIGEQGYFPGEPLMVVPSTHQKGKFDVVEGNRRLTAVKLLANPKLGSKRKAAITQAAATAKFKPSSVPCQVYERREDLLHFLAFRHVTGIKPWDPLMKARYLRQLGESPSFKQLDAKEKQKRLAREIGSTPNYVARLLAGLAVYEELEERNFFGITSLEGEGDRYSVLTTAVTSYTSIAKYIGLESATDANRANLKKARLENLARWLFEREPGKKARVPESRALQQLNRVVANAAALHRFERGGTLQEADLLTEGPLEAFRSAISEARSRLEIAMEIVHKTKGITDADVEAVHDIRQLVNALHGAARATRTPEE